MHNLPHMCHRVKDAELLRASMFRIAFFSFLGRERHRCHELGQFGCCKGIMGFQEYVGTSAACTNSDKSEL